MAHELDTALKCIMNGFEPQNNWLSYSFTQGFKIVAQSDNSTLTSTMNHNLTNYTIKSFGIVLMLVFIRQSSP